MLRPQRPLRLLALSVMVLTFMAHPGRARAQIDTLEIWNGSMGVPVIASVPLGDIMPLNGIVHVGYTRDRHLRHAWKDFGAWQFEAVADSALAYDIAVRGDGLASMALADGSGRLIFAARSPGGWTLDTLATYPGQSLRISLALDASPAIAFVVSGASGPGSLRYARRAGAGWTITEVGADADPYFAPALGFAPGGRPSIVCARTAATAAGYEVALYTGDGPDGPFSSAVIDSEGVGPVAHVWDVSRQRPFAFYRAQRASDAGEEYRSAYRDNTGNWRRQVPGEPNGTIFNAFVPVSMALDPVGAPAATWVRIDAILVTATRNETSSCGTVETGRVHVSTQRAAAPAAAYEDQVLSYGGDFTASGRAVSSHQPGRFDACYREPRQSCPQFTLLYAEVGNGTTAVPQLEAPVRLRLVVGPNPLPAGASVRVQWTQSAGADASLTLRDLAGRAVRRQAIGPRSAGTNEQEITTAGLAPGFYWLSLELDRRRFDSRPFVIR